MSMTGSIRTAVRALPTTITLAALVSGTLSIYASLQSLEAMNPVPYHRAAALFIMLALILDGLDGNLARLLKAESAIGGELDTFVDLTAFGIAPALLLYVAATGFPEPLRIALGAGLIASGAYRLARFKAVDPYRGQHGYLGLPITACASTVALVLILSVKAPDSWGPLKVNLAAGPFAAAFLWLVALLALLQISRVHFPKPSKNAVFFLPSIVLVILLFLNSPVLAAGSALIGLAFGVLYVGVSPFLKQPSRPAGKE